MGNETEIQEPLRLAADVSLCAGKVWAMKREVLEAMDTRFRNALTLGGAAFSEPQFAAAANKKTSLPVQGNGVAVIPIQGMIAPKLTFMAWLMGADYGLDGIVGLVKQAVADPDVKSIVFDIDSPGGLVDGVPEAADTIRQLRDDSGKPMVAVANTLTASAAYWLAAQAHEIVVTPSGEVGSVGVYQQHRDVSRAMEAQGVKHTLVSAGKYKVEGNPYAPLEGEALAATQAAVNDYYEMFVQSVANGRGTEVAPDDVSEGTAFGGGRTFTAARAKKNGLADRVATLGETISRLSSGRARVKRMAQEEGEGAVAETTDSTPWATYSGEDRSRVLSVLAQVRS